MFWKKKDFFVCKYLNYKYSIADFWQIYLRLFNTWKYQEQSSTRALWDSCSEKFCKIYKETTAIKSFSSKTAGLGQ